METHAYHHPNAISNEHWLKRHRLLTYLGLGILLYFLLVEHREHVLPILPYLFLLACPFMHMFMHGKHSHGGHSEQRKAREQ